MNLSEALDINLNRRSVEKVVYVSPALEQKMIRPLISPVIHYDAIDNGGRGIHHNSANAWKNLIGDDDASVELGNGFRSADGLNLEETRVSFSSGNVDVSEYTIFATFTPVFTGAHPRLLAESPFPTFYLRSTSSYAYSYYGQWVDTIFPWTHIPQTSKRNYVAFRCKDRKIELFVDWIYVSSLTPTSGASNGSPSFIGSNASSTRFLTGAYHSFRAYNKFLSDAEILQIAQYEQARYPNT